MKAEYRGCCGRTARTDCDWEGIKGSSAWTVQWVLDWQKGFLYKRGTAVFVLKLSIMLLALILCLQFRGDCTEDYCIQWWAWQSTTKWGCKWDVIDFLGIKDIIIMNEILLADVNIVNCWGHHQSKLILLGVGGMKGSGVGCEYYSLNMDNENQTMDYIVSNQMESGSKYILIG